MLKKIITLSLLLCLCTFATIYAASINKINGKSVAIDYSDLVDDIGDISGYVVSYINTTFVVISAGYVEANGKYYVLTAATTHEMDSLANGFDFHYIYIDDSGSTEPTAVIIDLTTEPIWNDAKLGHYNGDDRLIGVVASTSGASTVAFFNNSGDGKVIKDMYGVTKIPALFTNGNPDGTWQNPTDDFGGTESSERTPVNATSVYIRGQAGDSDDVCAFYATTDEMAAVNTSLTNGQINSALNIALTDQFHLILGPSRDTEYGGTNFDDNLLGVYVVGYEYSR